MSLRDVIEQAKEEHRTSLGDLTVLSPQVDPYRYDTPADRRKSEWLCEQMDLAGILHNGDEIHNRGVFYAILSHADTVGLDGNKFMNTAKHWEDIEAASKAARWLGCLPWDKIVDARNEEPIIRYTTENRPESSLYANAYALPDAHDFFPEVRVHHFTRRQKYRIAIYGEKTSLGRVLKKVADWYNTDLYLPSGEISNTQMARMAGAAANDGRHLVVLVFADCDPAGYQMAVSIGHKLRALRDSRYPSLSFELHAPALSVEQVKTLGLPSTPLKESELRAAGWRARYGVEQTEIDALATLRPDALLKIAEAAIEPFYDSSLDQRVEEAKEDWLASANESLIVAFGEQFLAERQARIADVIKQLLAEARWMSSEFVLRSFDLPPFNVPLPDLSGKVPHPPLISSEMSFIDHVRTLRGRKDYSGVPK